MTYERDGNSVVYYILPLAAPRQSESDRWEPSERIKRYRTYCAKLKNLADDYERKGGIFLPIPYKMIFYLPMAPSWSRKERERMFGEPHLQTPDKDNLEKGVLDAYFYQKKGGDSHVWSGWAEKRWSIDGAIRISPI